MIILVGVPLVLAGSYGYYYYTNNKKKVLEKALDMYASIIVYSNINYMYVRFAKKYIQSYKMISTDENRMNVLTTRASV